MAIQQHRVRAPLRRLTVKFITSQPAAMGPGDVFSQTTPPRLGE